MPHVSRLLLALLLAGCLMLPSACSDAQAQSGPEPSRPDWLVADPAAHGMEPETLADIVETAKSLSPLNSLLIARGDTTVVEWYAPGMTASRSTNIKSASKTVLGALVGIAIEEGYLEGPDQPIGPFFSEILDGTAAGDSVRQAITLGDLMTMRAGLESTSFGNYGAWVSADSWVENALERPMVDTPGGRMIYSTGTSHLVAVILEKATGQSLRAFAQKYLFDPIDEQIGAWQKDPEDYHFGGNNLAITPRALLKFGQLYLRGGAVMEDGQRVPVIPPDWIGASWNLRVLSSFRNFRYGYFWWMEEFGGERTYFAWGYGGQMLFVVPSLDLVTVMTSSLSGSNRGHSGRLFRFCRTINARL